MYLANAADVVACDSMLVMVLIVDFDVDFVIVILGLQ